MAYYELGFKLQHDRCPYNEFSSVHPAAVVSHWCNWSRDVVEIAHRDVQTDRMQEAIRGLTRALGAKVLRRSFARSNLQVVLQHCSCDVIPPPTLATIESSNCLELQPRVYTGGWEWYRVIAFSERDIRSLFRVLDKSRARVEVTSRGKVSEESVHENLLISTTSLFGELTEKQTKALITAMYSGYYRMPRVVNAGEIAKLVGMPRTSFVDHLRKAENKVLLALEPYLRMRSAGTN
jgi:predicted DNA binding protein